VHNVKFGSSVPTDDWEKSKTATLQAEALGFYSISFGDHLDGNPNPITPRLECYTLLTALAMVTQRIRLMPIVTCMAFRTPALLAKMTTTLDIVSGGRYTAGLGAGWLREEFEANGYAWEPNQQRVARFQEGVRLLKAFWTQERIDFQGRYFTIRNGVNFPKPVQAPHPPIMIGGGGRIMLKVMGEEANIAQIASPNTSGAIFAGMYARQTKEDLKQRTRTMREFAAAAGRNPDEIELCANAAFTPAASRAESERMAREVAQRMGFADAEAARNSPRQLIGTVDEIKREIRSRIEDYGITYFTLSFATAQWRELFAREVMPEFAGVNA
jgi:probable F420-dependent oxidoreductase